MEWVVSLNSDSNGIINNPAQQAQLSFAPAVTSASTSVNTNGNNASGNNSNNSAQQAQGSSAPAITSTSSGVNRSMPVVGDFPTGSEDLQHFSDLQKHTKRMWVLAYGKAWNATKGSEAPQHMPPALQVMADAIQTMTASLERSRPSDTVKSQRLVDDKSSIAVQNYMQLPLHLRGRWILFVISHWLRQASGKPLQTDFSILRKAENDLKDA